MTPVSIMALSELGKVQGHDDLGYVNTLEKKKCFLSAAVVQKFSL